MSLTIELGRQVFTLINTFEVDPAQQAALVAELADITTQLTAGLPGFVGVGVHRSLDGRFVVNYVQWETRAHLDATLGEPGMREHLARVAALARSITPRFYEVAFALDAPTRKDA